MGKKYVKAALLGKTKTTGVKTILCIWASSIIPSKRQENRRFGDIPQANSLCLKLNVKPHTPLNN